MQITSSSLPSKAEASDRLVDLKVTMPCVANDKQFEAVTASITPLAESSAAAILKDPQGPCDKSKAWQPEADESPKSRAARSRRGQASPDEPRRPSAQCEAEGGGQEQRLPRARAHDASWRKAELARGRRGAQALAIAPKLGRKLGRGQRKNGGLSGD